MELQEYRLIGEHSYFEILEQSDFPPLYDVCGFETSWEDFLAIVKETWRFPKNRVELTRNEALHDLDCSVRKRSEPRGPYKSVCGPHADHSLAPIAIAEPSE